jgi:hypothetical protein
MSIVIYENKEEAILEAVELLNGLFGCNVKRPPEQKLIDWFWFRSNYQVSCRMKESVDVSIEDRASRFKKEIAEVADFLDKNGGLVCHTRRGWRTVYNPKRITKELQESKLEWVQESHVRRAQELKNGRN